MVRRILLTLFLVGWLLPSAAGASDSYTVIVTLGDGAGIEDIAEDYEADILAEIADHPVFLIQVDRDELRELEQDPRVVHTEAARASRWTTTPGHTRSTNRSCDMRIIHGRNSMAPRC